MRKLIINFTTRVGRIGIGIVIVEVIVDGISIVGCELPIIYFNKAFQFYLYINVYSAAEASTLLPPERPSELGAELGGNI